MSPSTRQLTPQPDIPREIRCYFFHRPIGVCLGEDLRFERADGSGLGVFYQFAFQSYSGHCECFTQAYAALHSGVSARERPGGYEKDVKSERDARHRR